MLGGGNNGEQKPEKEGGGKSLYTEFGVRASDAGKRGEYKPEEREGSSFVDEDQSEKGGPPSPNGKVEMKFFFWIRWVFRSRYGAKKRRLVMQARPSTDGLPCGGENGLSRGTVPEPQAAAVKFQLAARRSPRDE